ncbi:SIR2 family protein [Pseudomonas sp. S11A4]|uniref:SIR2 family protein n=1 Tax=Pseudomonas sp. S11A4 TaxID=1476791 RepID=UPI00215C9720|nr:SIR2 family protein [Pseudomonas sp. S11A4]MCR8931610.1 SIR2 family protein [Pseudomonas sp. S11A4]
MSVTMPEGQWPLIPDVANLTKFINAQLTTDVKYGTLLSELVKAERNPENIEDTLSFLRSLLAVSKGGQVRGLSEASLLELEKIICKIIVKKIDVLLPPQETPYHQLCKWIRSIDRKTPIEIFTTNYDLLMEQSLEDLEVEYFDGFVGARRSFFDLRALEDNLIPVHWTRLWKIHGSINWYKEEIHGQKKVYRSSEIKEDASHLIYPSHLKYEESRKMPYLALIDQLNRFIRKKSSLLIMSGYSFNDGHLNDSIINALKANPTAMVLALMYGDFEDQLPEGVVRERYPEAYRLAKNQHNLNIWTFNKAIIGTTPGRWSLSPEYDDADTDLRAFISSSKIDDTSDRKENVIKLGDFAVFASFLKRIIGSTVGGANG